jgi:hypothetical protein
MMSMSMAFHAGYSETVLTVAVLMKVRPVLFLGGSGQQQFVPLVLISFVGTKLHGHYRRRNGSPSAHEPRHAPGDEP